jgi:hypothetical protein
MDGHVRKGFPAKNKDAWVSNNEAICPGITKGPEVVSELLEIPVMGKDIDSNIHLDLVFVSISNSLLYTLVGKITSAGPQTVVAAAQIDSICSIMDSSDQLFHIAGRSQEFRDVCGRTGMDGGCGHEAAPVLLSS